MGGWCVTNMRDHCKIGKITISLYCPPEVLSKHWHIATEHDNTSRSIINEVNFDKLNILSYYRYFQQYFVYVVTVRIFDGLNQKKSHRPVDNHC